MKHVLGHLTMQSGQFPVFFCFFLIIIHLGIINIFVSRTCILIHKKPSASIKRLVLGTLRESTKQLLLCSICF